MPELQEILVEDMRDLLDAEKQLTKALPKMAKAASYPELRQAFTEHLEVTKNQITRLEQAFELLGERAKSKPCRAMKGLVEEGQEIIQEHEKGPMLDAALIGAAQKVEHYEISGYGTARTLAKALGQKEVAGLLDQTAKEEGETDKRLTQISIQMLKEVSRAKPQDLEDEMPSRGGRSSSARGGASRAMAGGNGSKKKVAAAGQRGAGSSRAKAGGRNGSSRGRSRGAQELEGEFGGERTETKYTTDHDEIRQWAEQRGAEPACVRRTGRGDVGMIRLDFPGYTGEESLEHIDWDDWFKAFDDNDLALLYQEHTAGGQKSNFNKLVSRETIKTGVSRHAARGDYGKGSRSRPRHR